MQVKSDMESEQKFLTRACKQGVWAIPFAKSKVYHQTIRRKVVVVIPEGMACLLILPKYQSNAVCGHHMATI